MNYQVLITFDAADEAGARAVHGRIVGTIEGLRDAGELPTGTYTGGLQPGPGHPAEDDGHKYRIVRMYARGDQTRRIIDRGLTIGEARAHCRNPETNSKTATGATARALTARRGAWFDGFEIDK